MSRPVLTEVSATVEAGREAELVESFRAVGGGPLPPGLLRTELVRGPEGRWRIQTLWRDREALEAMRATTSTPVALRLFRQVGVEPDLVVLEVEAAHVAGEAAAPA